MSFSTYRKYLFANDTNCWLFPLAVLIFLANEGVIALFFRFLAMFDLIMREEPNIFDNDTTLFWALLAY